MNKDELRRMKDRVKELDADILRHRSESDFTSAANCVAMRNRFNNIIKDLS
jgi:hypothetical protein